VTASIRINLLKWLIGPLLLINLVGALLIYALAWTPAQIAFDQSLVEAAHDLRLHLRARADQVEIDLSDQAERILRINHFDSVFYVARNKAGRTFAGDRDFPLLRMPEKPNDPLTYDGVIRNEPIRIVVIKTMLDTEEVLIGVAETLTKRRSIQSRILLTLAILEAVLALTSLAIVWYAVTGGLFPLEKMRAKLNARTPGDLSAVDEENLPSELRPLIRAVNGLLEKAQLDGKARQNFLANIAHQLRTPLAGFKTQLELLQQRHVGERDTARSANLMMSSTERMIRQTNQLLVLARAEPSQFEKKCLEPVELDKLMEESIQHFVQEADKKDIDIGFDLQPTRVMGDRFLLLDLIDNLVDNAIRYSPRRGLVTISCFQQAGAGRLVIEDSGPGVALSDREKIFNRFYRLDDKVAGNGLGLAIVRDIAKDHDAEIVLESRPNGTGTIFAVQFPPFSA
jgi:two-component system sensor histidine kinase TctE